MKKRVHKNQIVITTLASLVYFLLTKPVMLLMTKRALISKMPRR